MSQSLTLVSKLTVKSMKAQPKKNSVEKETLIATIYGRVNDKKVGSSDFGSFVRFLGEFEGINANSGEAYRSGELIVPKTLETILDGVVGSEGTTAVDFAVEVWVEPSEQSITGYTYSIKPLIKPAESDALGQLRLLAQSSTNKQIEAPIDTVEASEGEAKKK